MTRTLLVVCLICGLPFAPMLSPAAAREILVTQKGQQFTPKALTLAVGDEIVFVNDDTGTHNVFSESPANTFDLKAQRPGTRTKVAFPKAGQVDVRCAIHPSMRLIVDVK
ncbi:plastocyanin/azurin family copper-binding protein [Bosea sp. R86505]|uniref:plastocyanin/azurin family copper-binding protein n=1 Tax=Bosea sp. R86505 TaxID=3101710 RepID=UPI0036733EF9